MREQVVRILEGHTGEVNALVVCPSGRFLYSGSHDTVIVHWDVDSGQVRCCAVSSCGWQRQHGTVCGGLLIASCAQLA